MNIPFSPPDISEKEVSLVAEALRSGWITTGPKTKEFERNLAEYIGTNKVACLNSATAAMEMTLRLLGVGPGDEVILPVYTYTATCSVVCHVGATPIIVDVRENSLEMDYLSLDRYINEKTKVIIPVDIAGILCDYEEVYKCVDRNKKKFVANSKIQRAMGRVAVMSDSAHGFGAICSGKRAGNFADFTCYSFHAVKNLTTAEGGAVTWKGIHGIDDEEIYRTYMNLSLHGQTKDALNKNQVGLWEYDIVSPAYKCNMTDIQAAIGLGQLERYDEMLKRRQEIIKVYDETLRDFRVSSMRHMSANHTSSGHLYFINIDGIEEKARNYIIDKFAEKGVATNVHYKPLPMLTAYKNMGYKIKDYPNAYNHYKNEITLPLYSKLTDNELEYIVETIKEVLKEYRK